MKAALIFTGNGPIVALTSHDGFDDPSLLDRFRTKGIRKFIAYPVPIDVLKSRYGVHFNIVCGDLNETDDLRILDFDGSHALRVLPFADLGEPIMHEDTENAPVV